MTKTIEFHFDFGSPNAYLAHKVVPEIERRTGVKFAYVPVLLGGIFKATNNVSPVIANQGFATRTSISFSRSSASSRSTISQSLNSTRIFR